MKKVEAKIGRTWLSREYPDSDPILDLPEDKATRKLIADCQRDLMVEADRLARIKITIRG